MATTIGFIPEKETKKTSDKEGTKKTSDKEGKEE